MTSQYSIYRLTTTGSNRVYIGCTCLTPHKRLGLHRSVTNSTSSKRLFDDGHVDLEIVATLPPGVSRRSAEELERSFMTLERSRTDVVVVNQRSPAPSAADIVERHRKTSRAYARAHREQKRDYDRSRVPAVRARRQATAALTQTLADLARIDI